MNMLKRILSVAAIAAGCLLPSLATAVETHTVMFDLLAFGTRIGGGELVQEVTNGCAAVEPVVAPATGWAFCGWIGGDVSCVTEDTAVKADYVSGPTLPTYDDEALYTVNVNGINWTFTIDWGGEVTIHSVYPNPEALEIPAMLGGHPVTAIGENAFAYCDTLKSVTIPASVREIHDWAFEDCSALVEVTGAEGVEWISSTAFLNAKIEKENEAKGFIVAGCLLKYTGKDASYTVPAGVVEIGEFAFANAPTNSEGMLYLKEIKFNEGLERIGYCAFENENGNFEFGEVRIPDSVTEIREGAFAGCTASALVIGNGVTDLEWLRRSFNVDWPALAPEGVEKPVCADGESDFAAAVTLTEAAGKSAGRYVGNYEVI